MDNLPNKETDHLIDLLLLFPPLVRNSLTNSPAFRQKYKFDLDATLAVNPFGLSFRRSILYPAVQSLYQNSSKSVNVETNDGRIVQLTIERNDDGTSIKVNLDGTECMIPSLWFLSNDSAFRLSEFDKEVSIKNIQDDFVKKWRYRLKQDSLNHYDAEEFSEELLLNPRDVASSITNELRKPESDISVLIPQSLTYYERLIGNRDDAETIEKYIDSQAKIHIDKLLQWDFKVGLAQCLMFSAHPSFAPLIDISGHEPGEVEDFYRWLKAHGDRFSQLAGLEVGLLSIQHYPNIEQVLLDLATTFRDEDISDDLGRLSLSANLFIFADGELSRTGTFNSQPPFWRRMAAFAQASMIERELIALGIPTDESTAWVKHYRGQYFFMQTLADMRLEPRWLPDLMTAKQLKNEFLCRIRIAGERAKDLLPAGELRDVILSSTSKSIDAHWDIRLSSLPGPLEGGSIAPRPFPENMLEDLRQAKDSKVLEASTLAGVINFALVFRLEPEVATYIANILRTVKYRLSLGDDSSVTFTLLSGLAVVAAVTRSSELANELRILARVLRRRGDSEINAIDQMRIALIACASKNDIEDWCKAVGDWFYELAHEDIELDIAKTLHNHLRDLCRIVPQLWPSVAKADAALATIV